MDFEKDGTYQEELLVANWAQIVKAELHKHFYTRASHMNCPLGKSQH